MSQFDEMRLVQGGCTDIAATNPSQNGCAEGSLMPPSHQQSSDTGTASKSMSG
jgi:hypothetical protein